ncbi:hypothetical protein CcaverHIS002_0204090 [Cutaneotrichosporon cavernicola]|uniref:DUF1748-domain-containing protein n=1 Tax=Cutaneotrichosporon cavernicola TaxID=279322 RepID=A0AA48L142_9TREE|nr:uncharacterized protein CcaverHIS019_0204070 [Cutaneotrichosporon cavernicola]BEJ12073.1 hypothetical protein CspHIS471_0205330 [Cutaneotrichosporon sp. HIS471]BEI81249.1 hypothetical protein CcaverHIS002_0204090 [Cutaneotrichosporon cavernicola]BEI89045.1 hypothetical protein CcaverHIS019_0204070 [Cutaneotrichosporon cavernicola]BEI96820.1 hypothetical protein CcaverHIS631_0204090 [Cutaneotrichosporon cavernicola]BEJ04592.1 hypothetical protein CcaverHIS641_0204090 [Cutaneotrichosporon cav
MFGRLTRLAIDLVAISTLLAGIKRSTGYSLHTGRVKDSTWRNLLDAYLGIGENVFAFCCGFAVSSSYFRRQID